MIDEKKLIAEMEKLPLIHGRYDKKNANPYFINGAESMYEMIRELVERQPKVNEWIPFTIDDEGLLDCKIPDEGEEILVSDGVNVTIDLFMNDGNEWYLDSWNRDLIGLAWMPRPEPWKGE